VLQALANVFADRLRARRQALQGTVCFSNALSSQKQGHFFLDDWRAGYFRLQRRCERAFNSGLDWIAHFDIAAFYDSISHEELVRRLWPSGGGGEARTTIRGWLRTWSSVDGGGFLDHGIPQGPIASDFLAECFLLPLDEAMRQGSWTYLRYVDDIRIFGRSELEVRKAAVELDIRCKELGLAPQGKKFKLGRARSLTEALGELPSLAPPDNVDGGDTASMPSARAERLLAEALDGTSKLIADRSKAKYVFYRATASRRLLSEAVRLLPHHPEQIDAISHYLANHSSSARAVTTAKRMLTQGTPYAYVRGELWHLVARLGDRAMVRSLRMSAIADFDSVPCVVPLQWGAAALLVRAEKDGLGSAWRFIKRANPMVQGLIAEILPETYRRPSGGVRHLLASSTLESVIAIPGLLVEHRLTHLDLDLRSSDLSDSARIALRAVGVIRTGKGAVLDQVDELLSAHFGTQTQRMWRRLLGSEYSFALRILRQAAGVYDTHSSSWLQLQDSFNDLVIRKFIAFLASRQLPGARRLVDKNGDLVSYGVLLQRHQILTRSHAATTDSFRECHERRNRLPGSHPYERKGGARTQYLSQKEKRQLSLDLRPAYEHLGGYVEQNW
jgi:hypothetical protein